MLNLILFTRKMQLKIILKLLNKKGIINVGGPTQTIYKFAKKDNKEIKKFFLRVSSQKEQI